MGRGEQGRRTCLDRDDPRRGRDLRSLGERRLGRRGALQVTKGECSLHLVAGKFETPGVPDRDACGECGRIGQMSVGFSPLPGRDGHETEDLAMERGDHRIAAFERQREAILGKTACLAETPLVRSDQRDTAQPPGRMQLATFECVALHGSFGGAFRLVPLPAVQEEAGELDEVERVVAARPGLGPDQLPGQLDGSVEVIGQAREPERVPVRALVLPRPSARCDEAKPALDVIVTEWVGRDPGRRRPAAGARSQASQGRPRHGGARAGRRACSTRARPRSRSSCMTRNATRPRILALSSASSAPPLERLLAQHDRLGDAAVVVADERADAQRLCPRSAPAARPGSRSRGWRRTGPSRTGR